MLKLDIKPGESVKIGDYAVITLESKSGNTARLSIKADKSVPINRVEPSNAAQMAAKVGLSPA
jgi:sRNA-binding carbon storage regulator CsrA